MAKIAQPVTPLLGEEEVAVAVGFDLESISVSKYCGWCAFVTPERLSDLTTLIPSGTIVGLIIINRRLFNENTEKFQAADMSKSIQRLLGQKMKIRPMLVSGRESLLTWLKRLLDPRIDIDEGRPKPKLNRPPSITRYEPQETEPESSKPAPAKPVRLTPKKEKKPIKPMVRVKSGKKGLELETSLSREGLIELLGLRREATDREILNAAIKYTKPRAPRKRRSA